MASTAGIIAEDKMGPGLDPEKYPWC